MATKKKDNKGPATQSTGTQGVNAVGVNHGTKPNYAPGFTDVAGSPSYQQYGQQYPQQAPVVAQPVQQQVQPQTATNVQQNPVVQPAQTTPTANAVQPVQSQQFVMPQQIALPNGQTIALQQPQQPAAVNIKGVGAVQVPNMPQPNAVATQQPNEPSTTQQNAEYEQQKQYNQAVDDYLKAGGNPNAIRQHSDPNVEKLSPTPEQVQQVNAQKQAQTDDDEYVKTLKEYLDSKYQSPEDRAAQEKREARQRRLSAISEGLANVFNVGGAVAGARPAQWKSGVGELYANQEAEADKRRAEYRQALKDMIDYRTAIRNGDIAQARAIEERRRNDFYERKMLEDIASKQANDELKKQKQEADIKRNDQQQANRNEEHKAKMQGTWNPSGASKGSSSGSKGGSRGKKSSSGSKATGAAAAKSAKAAAKRRAKAATQGTKFGKK